MSKPKPKTLSVDEFLASTKGKFGGPPCRTCKEPNLGEINSALKEFNEARSSGKTSYPWTTFVREYLKPQLGYSLNVRSAKRHLETCLGEEIH